jgi:hypothetical protein
MIHTKTTAGDFFLGKPGFLQAFIQEDLVAKRNSK